MNWKNALGSIGLVALALATTACQKQEVSSTTTAPVDTEIEVEKVTIGFQKSALSLLIARDEKFIEDEFPNTKIEWKEFPAGPQMLEALAVGAVDYGYVGNTPPIFAQAAGKDLNYVGYEVSSPLSQALVVPHDSSISKIEDLKGKRIALQKGSSAHEFLSKILAKAGLGWNDIQPIWLPPADARAAFDKKSIDAWAVWDPFLASAERHGQAKVITKVGDFNETYSFYVANPTFIQAHPQVTKGFIKALNDADQWIIQNQALALEVYEKNTGLDQDVATLAFERRLKPNPTQPLTADVIQAQQNIADEFQKLGLIPNTLTIQPIVWTASNSN